MDTYSGDEDNYPGTVRVVEDGDEANETNLTAADRDLADRTARLLKLLNRGRIQSRPSNAAIRAIAPADRDDSDMVAHLGVGLYTFVAASVDADLPPLRLKPDSGGGCWHLLTTRNLPTGTAPLDGDGFLPTEYLYGNIPLGPALLDGGGQVPVARVGGRGQANGIATLGSGGYVPFSELNMNAYATPTGVAALGPTGKLARAHYPIAQRQGFMAGTVINAATDTIIYQTTDLYRNVGDELRMDFTAMHNGGGTFQYVLFEMVYAGSVVKFQQEFLVASSQRLVNYTGLFTADQAGNYRGRIRSRWYSGSSATTFSACSILETVTPAQ